MNKQIYYYFKDSPHEVFEGEVIDLYKNYLAIEIKPTRIRWHPAGKKDITLQYGDQLINKSDNCIEIEITTKESAREAWDIYKNSNLYYIFRPSLNKVVYPPTA